MKVFFCLTLFTLLYQVGFSQEPEVIIKSQVLDSISKNGIENVDIYSEDKKYFTNSDIDGAFQLNIDKNYRGKLYLSHTAYIGLFLDELLLKKGTQP